VVAGQALVTPLHFENLYQADWAELESEVRTLRGDKKSDGHIADVDGERVASLYRRACEHLALARARAYPRYLLDRLEKITSEAHQVIYQRRDFGFAGIRRGALVDFPRAVRAHAPYVWLSALLLMGPMLLVGWLIYLNPDLILSVVDAETAAQYEYMYSDDNESIGAMRDAGSDWQMFGFYIQHNISIAFKCFASGFTAGVGTIIVLIFNGVQIGAVAGFLTERGLSSTFYSFVVTHGAFELTGIVIAGAAGLRLGHSIVAPGRNTRRQSIVKAVREVNVIIFGFIVMLLIAAAIEAFWSSARWLPLPLKYSVAGTCWFAVFAYFLLQGRRAN
jgi:uncharacterized membrane protein SpoIIM required for sporulation